VVDERGAFDVELDDGRTAYCEQSVSLAYADAAFSAGMVYGIEPDVLYLEIEKDEIWTMFFRPDELQALIWVAAGALWAHLKRDRDKERQADADKEEVGDD